MDSKKQLEILKCLVGSQAHGLATEDSDKDYRGVFVVPTSEFFKVGQRPPKENDWIEGEGEDATSYEIGHFLHLATKSNPSILEIFKAVDFESIRHNGWPIGAELKSLFPHVWSSKGVIDAFKGYSHNQHKKMFDEKPQFSVRRFKYAVAYVRVLIEGIELLRTGDFSIEVKDNYNCIPDLIPYEFSGWKNWLKGVKGEQVSYGEIIDVAEGLRKEINQAYEDNPNKGVNYEPINEFLLKVRKEFW